MPRSRRRRSRPSADPAIGPPRCPRFPYWSAAAFCLGLGLVGLWLCLGRGGHAGALSPGHGGAPGAAWPNWRRSSRRPAAATAVEPADRQRRGPGRAAADDPVAVGHWPKKDPPQSLRAVLSHEWAHIRNHDLWLLALGRCLLAAPVCPSALLVAAAADSRRPGGGGRRGGRPRKPPRLRRRVCSAGSV